MDRKTKIMLAGAAIALAISVALVSCPGCASKLDGARQALTVAQQVQTAAITQLEKYDADHQADIITAAASVTEGQQALMGYRIKRALVIKVILDAAAVTSVGASLIPLVESGQKKMSDLDQWLLQLVDSGIKIKKALEEFGVAFGGAP